MEGYRAANPIHDKSFSKEDLWWVSGAWTEEHADHLASTWVDIPYRDVQQFFTTFSGAVRSLVGSSLPNLVPSGTWMLGLIERSLPYVEASNLMANFRGWEDHPELSDPLRFYLFLGGNRVLPERQPGVLPIFTYSELLLHTASFTEADLRFLLVDGGKKVAGGKSRDQFVKEATETGSLLSRHKTIFPALASGALPYQHVDALLRNHSFAKSELFIEYVFSLMTEEDRDRRLEPGGSLGGGTPFTRALANPAVPTATLEELARRLEDQTRLYRLFIAENNPPDREWRVKELSAKVASRAGWKHIDRESPYVLSYAFTSLLVHPNWVQAKNENGLLPTVKALLPQSYREVHGTFHTLDLGYEKQGLNLVDRGLAANANVSGASHQIALDHFMTSAPYHPVAKERVAEVVFSAVSGHRVNQVSWASAAFDLGYYFSEIDRVKAELAADGVGGVPDEWVFELLA